MKKASKVDAVETMRKSIAAQKGAVIAEYRGLTVGEITRLRRSLRQADAEFRVVKNTLMRIAARDTGFERLEEFFVGPTAVGFAHGDAVAMARAIREFATGTPKIRLKAGYLDGRVLTAAEVETLADLPPREVLVAQLVGGLASPLRRLSQALSGVPRKMVYALSSIHDKKSQSQETA